MRQEINKYRLKWDTNINQGIIDVEFVDGQRQILNINTGTEYAVVVLMLSKKPVYFDDGAIESDMRQAGT